jgi:hypothetical protein
MTRRSAAALVFLLAVGGATAQQNQSTGSAVKNSKDDSTRKAAAEGARELFYLAVARKDTLPPIPRASPPAPGKTSGGTTAPQPVGPAPAPAPVVHLGIRYNVLLVDNANHGVAVDSDHVFRKGDRVAIEIEANHSGYLYVLARQSSGSWQALLPSPEMSDESNVIDPGRKVRVPEAYYFEIQDPPGAEHLVLVFSRDPQDFYELYQGIKNQNAAPAPSRPDAGIVQLADASRVDSAVAKMRREFGTRDIAIRKVSQPLSAGEPTGSVYVVNSSAKPASSVVTEIEVNHR